jgi:hypothetical protein
MPCVLLLPQSYSNYGPFSDKDYPIELDGISFRLSAASIVEKLKLLSNMQGSHRPLLGTR